MLERTDYKKELELFPYTISIGEKGSGFTKKIQEWICLHKYHTPRFRISIDIDDWYGHGTASAVREFQRLNLLEETGEVDNETWIALTAPMMRAFRKISFSDEENIQNRLVSYMNQFVDEHPTEIGNNTGPWVRAFMKGKEGDWAAWCNGVVSTALDHAADSMNKNMSYWLPWSWSTQLSRKNALKSLYSSKYLNSSEVSVNNIEKGDLFLVLRKGVPRHIGVISEISNSTYKTLEGNTNNEGSREGYELCERRRNLLNGKYGIIKLI